MLVSRNSEEWHDRFALLITGCERRGNTIRNRLDPAATKDCEMARSSWTEIAIFYFLLCAYLFAQTGTTALM